MKRGVFNLLVAFVCLSGATACTADETEYPGGEASKSKGSVQEWIYEQMCEWYLWNDDIKQKSPDYVLNYERFFYSLLSSNRNDGKQSGGSYFYSQIERVPVGTRSTQGTIEAGFGFEFGLVARQLTSFKNGMPEEYVYAQVTYVYEGSPAWKAGIRRGHCIGRINGTHLTVSNYETLYPLLLPESHTGKSLSTAELTWFNMYESGEVYVHETGASYQLAEREMAGQATLVPATIEHHPVFHYEVLTSGNGSKVGYLVYNAFDYGQNNRYDDALKSVFHVFKNEGVSELVLDLRYNGGGYVSSSQLMASMIVPQGKVGSHYQKVKFNNEVIGAYGADGYDMWLDFLPVDQMKSEVYGKSVEGVNLNLEKIYVLATDATASASECLINGLRGADVQVYHIGTTTEGKNVGMHLIGPETGAGGIYDGYEYRIWPVSFYCYNAKGSADFEKGFIPDYICDEFEQIEWKDLGEKEEALLFAALHHIETGNFPSTATRSSYDVLRGNSLQASISSVKFNKSGGSRIADVNALRTASI